MLVVPAKKGVSFNEEVVVEQFDPDNVKIDEGVIDRALDQIQNADPTGMTEDSGEMLNLEGIHLLPSFLSPCVY